MDIPGLLNNVIFNITIGPFEIPIRLNGNTYNNFLINNLLELLEDVPLNIQQQLIFQHGVPPHNARCVHQSLNKKFPERWIGCGGPIS